MSEISGNLGLRESIDGKENNLPVSIYPHPFSVNKKEFSVPEGKTVAEILSDSLPDGTLNVRVAINDLIISKEQYSSIIPKRGDIVTVRSIPYGGGDEEGGKDPLRTILQLAIIVVSAYVGNYYGVGYGLAVSLGGNLALNALVPPPTADTTNFGSSGTVKPSYAIARTQNQLLPFGVVPRALGRSRMYPPYAAKPYTETKGSNVYSRMLFCLGCGPLDKSNLKIGETLISEYQDVEVEYLTGNEVSSLYPSSINQADLSISLPGGDRTIFDGGDPLPDWTVQTTDVNTTTFTIDFYAPLLQNYYRGTRNVYSSVEVQVVDHTTQVAGTVSSIERNGVTSGTIGSDTVPSFLIVGNNGSAVRGSETITMSTSGQWDIKVRRLVVWTVPWDYTTQGTIETDLYWIAIKSEVPGEAPVSVFNESIEFIAMKIRISEQLNGIVDSFNLIVEAHHPVYNGSSWSVQATRNPAWVYAGIFTDDSNKRALDYSRLDADGLLTWANNCDTNGFEFGAIIIDKVTLLELSKQICSVGKASFGIVDGKYGVIEDKPLTTPVQLFTPRNSWGGSGQKIYSIEPHALRCKFIDHSNGDAPAERIVFDDGYDEETATIYEEMDLAGVRDSDHAWILGRYFLAALRLRPEVFERYVDFEHLVCTRGDLVWLRDDVMLVGLGQARIKTIAIDGSDVTITCDDELYMEGGTDYGVRIRTNTSMISVQVTTVPGYTSTLSFSLAPASSALLEEGNLFAFGEFGSEVLSCIVKEIRPEEELTALVRLVSEAPGVHTAHGGSIPAYDPGITLPPDPTQEVPTVPTVDQVISDESVVQYLEDGTILNCIVLSFHISMLGDSIAATNVECQYRAAQFPYLVDDEWTDSPPDTVSWNQHTLYYNGGTYTIAADSTTDQYIYWQPGESTYDTSASYPEQSTGVILIAQNTAGVHSLESLEISSHSWIVSKEVDLDNGRAKIVGVSVGEVYEIRLRSVSQYGVKSAWVYETHVTVGYTTPPEDVTSVQTSAGSGSQFVGRDLDVVWTADTIGVPGLQFEVTITHGAGDLRIENVSSTHYQYTYAMNVEDGSGTPSNAVTVKIRAFNSGGYSSTVTTVFTNQTPATPSGFSTTPYMSGLEFSWSLGSETDLDYYEYRTQVESEGWGGWISTPIEERRKFLFLDDTQAEAYPSGATISIEVRAVDTFGNTSSAGSTSDITGTMYIPATALTDFEQISGAFPSIPILRDFTWASNDPSAGYVSWTSGSLWYNGTENSITGSNSNNHWIYWDPNGTTTVFVGTDDDSTIPAGSFVIAVNNSGTYSLVWNNASANQVIGSAWINNLHGTKIVAGTLTASQINGSGFGNLTISSGTITIETTDGLTISGSGNIKVTAGNDINLIGDDSDPGKLNCVGTSYITQIGSNEDGTIFSIDPLSNGVIDFRIGDQFFNESLFDEMKLTCSGNVYIRTASWDGMSFGSSLAQINMYQTGSDALIRFLVNTTGSSLKYIDIYQSTATYYMAPGDTAYNKFFDLGLSGQAWDDAYADDYNNEADIPFLDTIDDLGVINDIKGSSIVNGRTGFKVINDSTLKRWFVTKYKNDRDIKIPMLEKGESIEDWTPPEGQWHWVMPGDRIRFFKKGTPEYSPEGKPYISTKTHLGLHDGAFRQLIEEQNQIHDMIEYLQTQINNIKAGV